MGNTPQSAFSAGDFVAGLVRRGMPQHIAEGFAMNGADESGFNPRAVGDNGNAIGLLQWNGPRKRALEAFAANAGRDVWDADTQMDYLMQELQGPEAEAWAQISATKDNKSAAVAILNLFERPAEDHRVRREAAYWGTSGEYVARQMAPDPDGVTWDETTYVGVNAALGPDRYQIQAQQEDAPQPYESFWGEVGASMQSSSWTAHLSNWMGEGVADPNYTPSQMFDPESIKQFPDFYHDYLLTATSLDNAKGRIKWVEEDMVRRQRLEAGGGSAVAAELLGGMLDPVPLVAGVLTGGLGVLAKGGMAVRAVAGAAAGASVNAGMDLVAQEVFDDPYADPVMAGLVGAAFGAVGGALARNPATTREAEIVMGAAARTARGRLAASGAAPADVGAALGLRSVGAAENPGVIGPLLSAESSYLTEIADEAVPYGFGGKLDFSVAGQMTSSSNPLTRQSGYALFEAAAGTKGHAVTQDSVNTVQRALDRKFIGNFMSAYHPARMAYLKEQNIWGMNLPARAKASREFSDQVGRYVEDPTSYPNASPHVVKAANAFSAGMKEWNRAMREAGLADIPDDAFYVPKVANHEIIADVDMRFREDDIHRMLGEAILSHSPTLEAKLVERMAKGYWRNLRRAAYGMGDDLDRSVQSGDFDGFKRAMADALEANEALDEGEMKAAFDALTGALEDSTKPTAGQASKGIARLKKRTMLDYTRPFSIVDKNGKTHSMAVRDLFENDAEMLFRRYTRSMSGRVAFANMRLMNPSKMEVILDGVRSEADLQKWKDMILESYRKTGRPKGEWENEAKNAIENIDFGWKKINGIPVWEGNANYARWARRIKQMQFARLMSNMGLNQIQESWKILSLIGPKAALSQLPAIRGMTKAIAQGKVTADELLNELMDMTGIGLDGLHTRLDLRIEDDRLGTPGIGRFERGLDNALDAASEFTTTLSGMRAIHDFQQRWALKAITQRIADMGRTARRADGTFNMGKIGKHEWNRLASMGVGKEDAEMLFRNLLDNAEFEGKKIVGVNVPKWDPEAVTKFRYFVGRYTDRLVQQNDYGALAKWMSHPVLSMFTQFRSFVYGAWAKSTLWTFNHGGMTDPRMMVMLLGEIAAGTATYAVRQMGQLGTEEGREKFYEQLTDPVHMLKNGWGRTATASIIPMMLDSMAVLGNQLGFEVEPQFGGARASGSAADAFVGIPLADQGASLISGLRGVKQAVFYGEDMTQRDVKSLVRALPLPTNYVPFTAALGALIKDLDEK